MESGRNIPEEIVKKISALYEEGKFSWTCPGEKDYVSVKITDSTGIHKQKRLVLVNFR
jgi:hypothetical protein